MKSLWSAVLSWCRATPLNMTCTEAPCSSTGWVLSCHSSVSIPGFSDLKINSTCWVSPGRITPGQVGEEKRQPGSSGWRLIDWWTDTQTNSVWRKRVAAGVWLCLCVCTRGGIEVEVRVHCLWFQLSKAVRQGKLLPAVEDGCAALIVELQVGQSSFSSHGLKEYCGTDSYVSLMNECWRIQ